MRAFETPDRPVSVASQGMVATSNPQAALAGLDVLRAGGNAVDAAVAAAAMLAVVEPTQTGIGGDCFVLLKQRGSLPVALNGAGWAPRALTAERLRAEGLQQIAADNVHAVTVPGALRAWERLVADHGRLAFGDLLRPAIAAAEQGYRVTERLARDWALSAAKVSASAQARAIFMPGGQPPQLGDLRSNLPLATALRAIANDGADVFYQGWIAEDIVASLQRAGSAMVLDDLADYQPEYVEPLSTAYRGYRLWECPPSGQGIVALQMAAMLDQLDLAAWDPLSAERFHLQAEVARIAYAQRDAQLCDPRFHRCDAEDWLSPQRVAQWLAQIDLDRRQDGLQPTPSTEHRDTVYISVVDADGMAVSLINSLFDDFGSGRVSDQSGVLLHNRGCGFSLEAGHPNALAGRKRPMHTIIPALLTEGGEAVMAFGVTGGHFQPAGQLQVLSNIVDYGMSIQQAIDHPRMLARGDQFEMERTVPEALWSGLRAKGHLPVAAAHPLGTCHAIWIDQARGVLLGGSDGRRDGLALGY